MTRPTKIADALRAAWTTGPVPGLPADLTPADEAEAYAVQLAMLEGAPVAGWKVTPKAPYTGALLAQARLVADGDRLPGDMPAPEVEVEIAVIFARDLPPRATPYAEAEVLAACGGLRAAFEIVQSRFVDRKAMPPLAVLADAMSNGAFGLGTGTGAAAADWTGTELGEATATLSRNGQLLEEKAGGFTTAQVVGQLVWLANHASSQGLGLKAGQALITGARIGPRLLTEGGRYTVSISGVGEASFVL
ncbi:2-keto-4-pentenoate hydratase [Neotabrizicola sp. VNH66]|uniref:2-keto-4-pentenoate hydratase n=1 Tax=Neotabrizicola sp. VNH66 TaxID=3400918 RepID=UPI003BFE2611